MARTAEHYEKEAVAAEARGATHLAELYRQTGAELSGGVAGSAGAVGVSPSPGTAVARPPSLPPLSYTGFVVPPAEGAEPRYGRERDTQAAIAEFNRGLTETEKDLTDFHIFMSKLPPEEARARAKEEVTEKLRSMRFNVEGEPEPSHIESAFPPTRESRIYWRRVVNEETGELENKAFYLDPDDPEGDWREPTRAEHVTEAFAKQELMSPEKIARQMRQLRQHLSDITRQLNYDQILEDSEAQDFFDQQYKDVVIQSFDEMFMYTRPGEARTIETVTGAAFRSWFATVSTLINTVAMGYSPLVWEQDPATGEPVDPNSWAYRIHEGLIDQAVKRGGMTPEDARETFSGAVELPTPPNLYTLLAAIPGLKEKSELLQFAADVPGPAMLVPFQPTQRTQATSVDPYGVRVASATGDFIIDYATALARGRSAGDEFMSAPALREERAAEYYRAREDYTESSAAGKNTIYEHMGTTTPYWYGVGLEVAYGIGPFKLTKELARLGSKGLTKASKQLGSTKLHQAAFTLGHPIKAAELAKAQRLVGDLLEGRAGTPKPDDLFDAQVGANNVRRVAGEYGGSEMQTPYLMQMHLYASEAAVDGRDLNTLVQGTAIGPYLRKQAGFGGAFPERVLTQAERTRLNKVIYQWRAEVYRPGVMQIVESGVANPEARIRNLLAQGGVTKKVLPALDNKQKLSLEEWVKTLYPNPSSMSGALPVQPGKPVPLQIHKLGSDLVKASRSADEVSVTGELGRIFQRRMGEVKLNPATIRTHLFQVASAARASAGRAIEATIENEIPDDFVFVTRSVIAPIKRVTRALFAKVKRDMEPYRQAFTVKHKGRKVDGAKVNDVTVTGDKLGLRDAILTAFGAGNIRRNRDLTRILRHIDAGPDDAPSVLSEGDMAYVLEQIESDMFRLHLMDDISEADEPAKLYSAARTAFGGPQTERAMVERVNVGLDRLPETRVARRNIVNLATRTVPLLISEAARVVLPSKIAVDLSGVRKAVHRAKVWATAKFGKDAPFLYEKVSHGAIQRLFADLKSRVGGIGDNFQRELRDATTTARAVGFPNPGAAALNGIVKTRITRVVQDKIKSATEEAERLMSAGQADNDAWYRVAYTTSGDQGGAAVGELIQKDVRDATDWAGTVRGNIAAQVMEDTWENILSLFFDKAEYDTIKDAVERWVTLPGIDPNRATRLPGEYLMPSLDNLKAVIEKARVENPRLKERGKGENFGGIPTGFNDDALSQVLTAWAVGADEVRTIDRGVAAMRIRSPEVWVELMPSAFSSRPNLARSEQLLSVKNRTSVYRTLIEDGLEDTVESLRAAHIKAGDDAPTALSRAEAEIASQVNVKLAELAKLDVMTPRPGVDEYGLAPIIGGGAYTRELDKASARMYNSFSPKARQEIISDVLTQILKDGTVDIDFNSLKKVVFAYKKDATLLATKLLAKGLQLARSQGDTLNPGDTALLDLWELARSRKLGVKFDRLPAGATPSREAIIAMENVVEGDLAMRLADGLMSNAFDTLIVPAVEEFLSNARALGFTPGRGPGSLQNIVANVMVIDPYQPAILLMGDSYSDAIAKLVASAKDGRLIDNLEMLTQRDRLVKAWRSGDPVERGKNAAMFAINLIKGAFFSSRTLAAGGLLAGGFYAVGAGVTEDGWPIILPVPAPNMRYIGMNLLTAPLLALTTVGAVGALRAARGGGYVAQAVDVAKQAVTLVPTVALTRVAEEARMLSRREGLKKALAALPPKLVDAVTPRPPDAVVFTSRTGRRWTQAALQDAMGRANIQITRGSIEFQEAWMRDLMRDAHLASGGSAKNPWAQFLRTFDPLRTNIFQYVANATDRAFRHNTFASALKEGMTEQQAGQLAKAVVLDYGRAPGIVRTLLNRVMLFVTFRLSMMLELIESIARDGGVFSRKMLALRDSHQASTQYLYGADYTKSRIVVDPTKYVFDGTAGAMNYGPSDPGVDSFSDLLSMGAWVIGWFQPEVESQALLTKGIAEENLHPVLTKMIEGWIHSSLRQTDKGWKVPDWALAWALHNGPDDIFPWFREAYDIRPVLDRSKRIPGRPSFREDTDDAYYEWYFSSVAGMERFKTHVMWMTLFQMKRTTEDMTKNIMAGHDSDYIKEQRRGNVPLWSFAIGAQTPIGAKDPEEILSQTMFELKRAQAEMRTGVDRR